MPTLRIEMDRGDGWEIRSEGIVDATAEQAAASLQAYAVRYPHRALLDGEIVGTAAAPRARRRAAARAQEGGGQAGGRALPLA